LLNRKEKKMSKKMPRWIVAYGIGGCWSGYPFAKIIEAPTKLDAESQTSVICRAATADERSKRYRGASYDVELIEDDFKNTGLWCSRLLPSAKEMLEKEESSVLDFKQGHAVVASRYFGDVLISFHDSVNQAVQAVKKTIDSDPLRTEPSEVCFAKNGNVRMWRLNQAGETTT